jgi:putative transcriptional regulator
VKDMSTGSPEPSLVGYLLVATPLIGEGVFERAVVLVVDHSETEAFGVILNLPSEIPVDEILPAWGDFVSAPSVIFQGGPVGDDSALAIAAVERGSLSIGLRPFAGPFALVDLDGDPSALKGVMAARAFVGYAGWSAGQLEEELSENSWFTVPAEVEDLSLPAEGLYQRVLRRAGGVAALHSTYLASPVLN